MSRNPYAATLAELESACVPETSARLALERTLARLMRERGVPASRIAVAELCREAHVSRSLFYRYHHGIDGVLDDMELRLLHRLAAVASDPLDEPNASVMTDAFATVVRVIEADEELFRLLVVDVPDERFVARWKDGIAAYLWRRLFDTDARDGALRLPVRDGAPTVNRELMVEMFTGMMLAFVRFRLEHPERVRMEEVMALMPELTAAISRVW